MKMKQKQTPKSSRLWILVQPSKEKLRLLEATCPYDKVPNVGSVAGGSRSCPLQESQSTKINALQEGRNPRLPLGHWHPMVRVGNN